METPYLNTLIKMTRKDTPEGNINQHDIINSAEKELNELKDSNRLEKLGYSEGVPQPGAVAEENKAPKKCYCINWHPIDNRVCSYCGGTVIPKR